MAAYISVPRDLTRVKSKILFNLTKRQLICFSVAAIVGVPVFFLLKRTGNVSLATLGMMLVMLPMFFLGMYEKGPVSPLEKIAQHFIRAKITVPGAPLPNKQLLCSPDSSGRREESFMIIYRELSSPRTRLGHQCQDYVCCQQQSRKALPYCEAPEKEWWLS